MSDLSSIPAVSIAGEVVSLGELLRTLKVAENLGFIDDAIGELLVTRAAREEEITVGDQELQEAVDQFRAAQGLHKAEETRLWLAQRHWTVDDLEAHLERELLREKLMERIATHENIERHFAQHRHAYDRAVLAHIAVADEALAKELLARIREEDADFAELAKQHSIDKATKPYGGEVGVADRTSLSPSVESAVFSANDGDVVGPIKTDMGYHLIKVHHLLLGKLDKDAAAAIRGDLANEFLDQQRRRSRVEIPLLEAL